jgi:hypothetical protein
MSAGAIRYAAAVDSRAEARNSERDEFCIQEAQRISNPMNPDWMGDLQGFVVQMVTQGSSLFVPFGQLELAYFGVFGLVMIVIRSQRQIMDHFHYPQLSIFEPFWFLIQVLFASTLLTFYSTPMPGTSLSVHQFFPYIGQQMMNAINSSMSDDLLAQLTACIQRLQRPGWTNLFEICVYMQVYWLVGLLEACSFCMSALGFFLLGVWTLIGPLAIPFFVTKQHTKYFWSWVENIAAFSLYGFIAACEGFVFSGLILKFFHDTIGGHYTIAIFVAALPVMATLTLAYVLAAFMVPIIVSKLVNGAGASGQAMMSGFARTIGVSV